MPIINELSSQIGDKTEASNRRVAERCLKTPALLDDITRSLDSNNQKLVADCAEVLTIVSETHPELITPYIQDLAPLLDHTYTKVRWEATHTLAQLASTNGSAIQPLLEPLMRMALSDKSKIVQDYATVTIGNYGSSDKKAAVESLPLLARILDIEGDRQAVRVLDGMSKLLATDPTLGSHIRHATNSQANSTKSSIKRVYGKLVKQLDAS